MRSAASDEGPILQTSHLLGTEALSVDEVVGLLDLAEREGFRPHLRDR